MPKIERDRINLLDVARRAGCSPATVSRVMNDNQTVGGEVRERVLRAAADLGYVPNGSARALRSSRTRLMGAVIPTVDHSIYASMIDGLQVRLSEKKVSLILSASMYDAELEFEQVRQLVERGAEAVILVGGRHKPQTIEMLDQRRIAHVETYTVKACGAGVAIGFDNEKAGRTAARFLLDLGHTRLAMVAGITQDNDRAADHVAGFLAEAASQGIDAAHIPVVEAAYSVAAGGDAIRSLLATGYRPTAVFCGSDTLAAGVVKYCHENGIEVPREMSVLGFDNLEIAELTTPELTTLEVPAREMGLLAANYLTATPAQRMHQRGRELAIRLIVRGSTGVAPSQH